jgi:hypothetical protein
LVSVPSHRCYFLCFLFLQGNGVLFPVLHSSQRYSVSSSPFYTAMFCSLFSSSNPTVFSSLFSVLPQRCHLACSPFFTAMFCSFFSVLHSDVLFPVLILRSEILFPVLHSSQRCSVPSSPFFKAMFYCQFFILQSDILLFCPQFSVLTAKFCSQFSILHNNVLFPVLFFHPDGVLFPVLCSSTTVFCSLFSVPPQRCSTPFSLFSPRQCSVSCSLSPSSKFSSLSSTCCVLFFVPPPPTPASYVLFSGPP